MKALVVGNWKMNPATYAQAKALFDATKKAADAAKSVMVVAAPPSLYLRELSKGYRGRVAFAVQNARPEETAAKTGSISLAMAKDARVSYAIIGHAERRAEGETNEETNAKIKAALDLSMTPVLCVGETKREASGEHFRFVREQLRAGLSGVAAQQLKRIVIAYEPVWAIGAPAPMSPRDMHEMSIFIRKTLHEIYGAPAHTVKILYGGSIDDKTAVPMLQEGDVDGLLPGRVSIDPVRFKKMLEAIAAA